MLFLFFQRIFMRRIDSSEKLKEMGRKVKEKDLQYKIFSNESDMLIEIFEEHKKVFEFVCERKQCQNFFDEAVRF